MSGSDNDRAAAQEIIGSAFIDVDSSKGSIEEAANDIVKRVVRHLIN
ncbi:hypothetical protein [Bacillus sp. 3255]|nr:hypothetical protein [Bacillus sp. 3255]